jgi:hypothetical protein
MKSLVLLFGFSMLAAGLLDAARADTVWNKQGIAVEGEVISDEPSEPLVFRCKHKGEWKTFEIAREQIQRCVRVPGDQSDGISETTDGGTGEPDDQAAAGDATSAASSGAGGRGRRGILKCTELRPIIEGVLPPIKAGSREVVVLELVGPFEPANIFDVGRSISFGVVDVLLDIAAARDPAAIVLKMDSGGGRVDQMDLIVERLLKEQDVPNKRRVVAWVNLGGSAAALTALACKELVMMPQGRLGAAIRTRGDGEAVEPQNALEQKVEAMRDARRQQVASLTGRPLAIQDAMEKAEHQLWHHPVLGFSLEEQDEPEWEAYDTDVEKPLALAARAVVDLGIASGIAGDEKSLLGILKLPEDTKVLNINLASPDMQAKLGGAREFAKAGNEAVEAFKNRIKREIDDAQLAIRSAAGIVTATNGYTGEDLRAFRNALAKVRVPAIDKKTQDFLKTTDPSRLAFYEDKLAMARRLIQRASLSTETATRSGGIAIGPILDDLRFASKNFGSIVIDEEWEE